MTLLIIGLALFFVPHAVSIAADPWRTAMIRRLGAGPWKGLYSLVSIAGFVLIIKGYAEARGAPIVLWTPPPGMKHATAFLMLAGFPLFLATYLPGRIKTAVKHPMLAATKVWALAHLLANGTLADVLLFGSFLVWAGLVRMSMKWRAVPRHIPAAPASKYNDAIAVVGGLFIYGVFVVWAHRALFGVSPV